MYVQAIVVVSCIAYSSFRIINARIIPSVSKLKQMSQELERQAVNLMLCQTLIDDRLICLTDMDTVLQYVYIYSICILSKRLSIQFSLSFKPLWWHVVTHSELCACQDLWYRLCHLGYALYICAT